MLLQSHDVLPNLVVNINLVTTIEMGAADAWTINLSRLVVALLGQKLGDVRISTRREVCSFGCNKRKDLSGAVLVANSKQITVIELGLQDNVSSTRPWIGVTTLRRFHNSNKMMTKLPDFLRCCLHRSEPANYELGII